MNKIWIIALFVLAACHPEGTYTERMVCWVNGEQVVYEETRRYGEHGRIQWVSGIHDSGTTIRDSAGRTILEYSNAVTCTKTKINYVPERGA